MVWLVTGCNGYLGRALTEKLSNFEVDFLGIDNNFDSDIFGFAGERARKIDILNKKNLTEELSSTPLEGIIHLAALKDLRFSIENPGAYWENNFVGTLNLLNLAIEKNCKNFLFASTAAVYGDCTNIPISENVSLNPDNPYSTSKLACEWLITQYSVAFGLKSVALRLFNLAGSSPSGDLDSSVISKIVKANLHDLPFNLNGNDFDTADGTAIRDFIDVKDVAQIIYLMKTKIEIIESFEVFNVGSGKGTSMKELLEIVQSLTMRENKLTINPRNSSDIQESRADTTKLIGFIGDYDFIPVSDIVRSIVDSNAKF